MRGFYRIWGGLLCGLLPGILNAEPLCEDPRLLERSYPVEARASEELLVSADVVDLKARGISRLSGDVRMRRQDAILLADDVSYDEAAQRLTVPDKTFFETDSLQVSAQSAEILLEENLASFRGARYIAFEAGARGRAQRLAVTGPGQVELEEVRYTTCPAGDEAWVLEGDAIQLDSQRGMGSARNVRLRFKGVPLFWAPLFYFPVGEQRQTGLLPPRLGESDTTGLDISQPLYLNLAPNYDMTLTPRYLAQRGNQIQTELRGLWRHGSASAQVEYLPDDENSGEARHLVALRYAGGSGGAWTWDGEYLRVSDTDYLTQLNSAVADEAQSQLPQALGLRYRQRDYGVNAALSVREFQTLTAALAPDDRPYARLPEMKLDWRPTYRNGRARPSLTLDAVNFTRDDTVTGWRGNARLGLDWSLDHAAAFLNTHADYLWSRYDLETAGGDDLDLQRELPSLQVNTGLRLIRPRSGNRFQTLTPQINYLFVPFRDQDQIPIFDTSLPDFSFDQLFARNRFTGPDRIADANLVTTAVRSDWYTQGGQARPLSVRLGVQWRLAASRVALPAEQGIDAGSSDWLGELEWRLNGAFRARLAGQWNDDDRQIEQSAVAARYQPDERRFVQATYRFRRDNFEQTDLLAAWPVAPRWRLAGRWTYAVDAQRSLDALVGVEYRSCCWGLQLAWRRHLSGSLGRYNSSIYLQLELRGLGRVGEGLESLLERDIL